MSALMSDNDFVRGALTCHAQAPTVGLAVRWAHALKQSGQPLERANRGSLAIFPEPRHLPAIADEFRRLVISIRTGQHLKLIQLKNRRIQINGPVSCVGRYVEW